MPPYTEGSCAPGIVLSAGRMKFCARSFSVVCESVALESASWMIGTLEAL